MKPDCCCPSAPNPDACGCCEGAQALTPLPTANRPGLVALSCRIGTHGSFLETMKARLSSGDHPKLAELTTRESHDPAIALLDAWASVADVLTFYQERIANEGYLRTALERRSLEELARLVGYRPRPGVAASVHLAYTMEDGVDNVSTIPRGTRVQSIPGPGEAPQSFESGEDLKALARWNNLRPRLTQPQTPDSVRQGDGTNARIYLKGVASNLAPNDPLLIDFTGNDQPEFFLVQGVVPDSAADRTLVVLQAPAVSAKLDPMGAGLSMIEALTLPASRQPANSVQLVRSLSEQFPAIESEDGSEVDGPRSAMLRASLSSGEASYSALKAFAPALRATIGAAGAKAEVSEPSPVKVYALRIKAAPFGHNLLSTQILLASTGPFVGASDPSTRVIALDSEFKAITVGSWVVVERADSVQKTIARVESVRTVSLGGPQSGDLDFFSRNEPIGTRATVLTLSSDWRGVNDSPGAVLPHTSVFAQSEQLELAEEPIAAPVCGGKDEPIELDGLYEGLEAGRWVIVSGEREIDGTSGVRFSELAMLSSVAHRVGTFTPATVSNSAASQNRPLPRPAEKLHSFVSLAAKLAYCFKRDTVSIHGNVVEATHGETRKETLGSGDGSREMQSFALKQSPVTHVAAPNPAGVDSTLAVYVNDIRWHESDTLAGLSPNDQRFITGTDDGGKTSLVFGNGRQGARLPTGSENIKAEYRFGIGKQGNVKPGQITLLASRPLGVKAVINPLRASGGADRDSRDRMRKNAPLAVRALDRLVSVQDYEDFSRVFAGVGKARAAELSDGRRQLVHVTIAGADDVPIDQNTSLYRNLRRALLDFGDPDQALRLAIRELLLIVISGRVRILPDYQWETVVSRVRSALLDAFGFERRELGQDVLLSEVIAVVQAVPGVDYVDVDALGGIPERKQEPRGRRLLTPAEIGQAVRNLLEQGRNAGPVSRIRVNLAGFDDSGHSLRPAQLAFLTPEVAETLILSQII